MALLDGNRVRNARESGLVEQAAGLERRFGAATPRDVLEAAIDRLFPGQIALVSSFGAESAALLHMVAAIDGALPVLFVDTGKHFGETVGYRDRLIDRLALADVRTVTPDKRNLAVHDPDGMLFSRDADRCCELRKTAPLKNALEPFDAWITGRKRFQSAGRAKLPVFEAADGRIKVNPLAGWGMADIANYVRRHDLPAHPLASQGFRSIGCMPCTSRTAPGEDARAGRWRGSDKTECGIHLPGYEQDGSGI